MHFLNLKKVEYTDAIYNYSILAEVPGVSQVYTISHSYVTLAVYSRLKFDIISKCFFCLCPLLEVPMFHRFPNKNAANLVQPFGQVQRTYK